MQETQKQIRELLTGNVFLKQDLKDKVLNSMEKFSESALMDLRNILQQGVGVTHEVIENSAKQDPSFLNNVKGAVRKVGTDKLRMAEDQDRVEEEAILEELENELANI